MIAPKTLFVIVVAASTSGALLVERAGATLQKRQGLVPASVPVQCNPFCSPYFAEVQACGTANAACLCTSTVENNAVNCLNCVASVFPSKLSRLQADSDAGVQACTQHGYPIDPVKLTGVMPTAGSAPSPTAAGTSATGTTTAASTSTSTGFPTGKTSGSSKGVNDKFLTLSGMLALGVACVL